MSILVPYTSLCPDTTILTPIVNYNFMSLHLETALFVSQRTSSKSTAIIGFDEPGGTVNLSDTSCSSCSLISFDLRREEPSEIAILATCMACDADEDMIQDADQGNDEYVC